MTHREALTCAGSLVLAGFTVGVTLTPEVEVERRKHDGRVGGSLATVWCEVGLEDMKIDSLEAARSVAREAGYDLEFDGSTLNVMGVWTG